MTVIRRKSTRVIVGGMPRTGTNSVIAALEELGLSTYGYHTRLEKGHLPWWNSVLKAKLDGKPCPLDRETVDKMTEDYDCIADAPCFFLVAELAKLYPEAKVILNWRDHEKWLGSLSQTLQPSYEEDQRWTSLPLRWLDPTYARPIMIADELAAEVLCDRDYSDTIELLARYDEHYTSMEKVLGKRALRFSVQEGWKPFCEFLEVPAPDHGSFPRTNDSQMLLQSGQMSWGGGWQNAIRNLAGGVILAFGVVLVMQS